MSKRDDGEEVERPASSSQCARSVKRTVHVEQDDHGA